MHQLLFKFLILWVLILLLLPIFVSAQAYSDPGRYQQVLQGDQGYQPLAPIAGFTDENTAPGLSNYLNAMFRFGIYIATGLAVIMIIIGGITYISSDTITNKSEGKAYIEHALWGLGIALVSWALLNTINPALLKSNIGFEQNSTTNRSATNIVGLTQPGLGDKIISHEETRPNGILYDFVDGTHAWKSVDGAINCYDTNWSWVSPGPCR